MSNTIWALNCYHNDYNQHGPTLEVVWLQEPTVKQVREFLPSEFRTSGIETISLLNEFMDKNRKLVYHDGWVVEEIQVGAGLHD